MSNAAEASLILPDFQTSETPAGRVVEMIHDKSPHLLPDTPFILALCELYYQRRIKKTVPNE